ncbi:uncharacterized protein LOC123538295 [Mercenaria mercenaria]|uniref:uncharacterized protein LOC123538295 n=1 Tax=Mercenaria mercenaria TaxID=6596 RepID=UPI00234E76C5|nr:uncharacterized protein LOC123538295 [Mercenaria mercenaria]
MTCVLSMSALYTNPFSEDSADIQNKVCESFDFNWLNASQPHSVLSTYQRFPDSCHVEESAGPSTWCQMDISNGLTGNTKHEHLDVHNKDSYGADLESNDMEKHVHTNEKRLFEMCNETEVEPDHTNIKKHGVKRKAGNTESEEVYIPSKRVSPFLNTPKERKDKRKKILKISIKKLKQLDDPEAFLRRTVLVNNTTKRLQLELRQEKRRTKKFASDKTNTSSGYGALNNSCISDTYLIDDPFLCGVHEKITDDMTDTLINNVFHEKLNEKTEVSDIGEKSDIISKRNESP